MLQIIVEALICITVLLIIAAAFIASYITRNETITLYAFTAGLFIQPWLSVKFLEIIIESPLCADF